MVRVKRSCRVSDNSVFISLSIIHGLKREPENHYFVKNAILEEVPFLNAVVFLQSCDLQIGEPAIGVVQFIGRLKEGNCIMYHFLIGRRLLV